jgi:hypothetical protein
VIEQPPIRDGIQSTDIVPPQEPVANVRYRKRLREWAIKSQANRDWIMKKCKRDFYFWLESFAWLYEPRPEPGRAPILPFIPWPHQRPCMDKIIANSFADGQKKGWQQRDIGIEKARGEGATWMCLMIITWRWIFHPMEAFGLVSRNETTADNPDDPDSLGAKIDWALGKMPTWMVGRKGVEYKRNISKHTWINNVNGSTITAYPSTGDLASGGRKTVFFMDELSKFPRGDDEDALAATEPVANCRWLVSTYNGANGAYFRAIEEADDTSLVLIRLRWTDNPYRSVNKFVIDGSSRQLLDPDTHEPVQELLDNGYAESFFSVHYPSLVKRGFVVADTKRLLKKVWSPWYVDRCLRPRMTPQKIAQEYDMDPIGSGNRFFPGELLDDCLSRCKPPEFCGDIEYDLETLRITRILRSTSGMFRTWLPTRGGKWSPPPARYVVGCDVAMGLGTNHSSNSAIVIINRDTGQKVAEYASPTTMPERLAEIAIALCHFFRSMDGEPAFLAWEANGPGGAFRERVLSSPFRNVYYRTPYKTRKGKPSKEMGWWSSKDAKMDLLTKYRWALQEGFFHNPSNVAIREAGHYTTVGGGRLEFISSSADEDDPSDLGDNHGDRCIADAVANMAMEYLGGGATQAETRAHQARNPKPEQGSFLHRRQVAMQKARQKSCGW